MSLYGSMISCGVSQLYHIEGMSEYMYNQEMGRFRSAAFVIASLTKTQKTATKLLLDNGFKRIGEYKRNPNSGNMIALFVKRVGERVPKKKIIKRAVKKKVKA